MHWDATSLSIVISQWMSHLQCKHNNIIIHCDITIDVLSNGITHCDALKVGIDSSNFVCYYDVFPWPKQIAMFTSIYAVSKLTIRCSSIYFVLRINTIQIWLLKAHPFIPFKFDGSVLIRFWLIQSDHQIIILIWILHAVSPHLSWLLNSIDFVTTKCKTILESAQFTTIITK